MILNKEKKQSGKVPFSPDKSASIPDFSVLNINIYFLMENNHKHEGAGEKGHYFFSWFQMSLFHIQNVAG